MAPRKARSLCRHLTYRLDAPEQPGAIGFKQYLTAQLLPGDFAIRMSMGHRYTMYGAFYGVDNG